VETDGGVWALPALRVAGRGGTTVAVVDADRDEHCLLLVVRDDGEKSKFLCGLDRRHWLVAAIPESAPGVASVASAKVNTEHAARAMRHVAFLD
jgi:hypothetical protein